MRSFVVQVFPLRRVCEAYWDEPDLIAGKSLSRILEPELTLTRRTESPASISGSQ
jgi:hypothetical protein